MRLINLDKNHLLYVVYKLSFIGSDGILYNYYGHSKNMFSRMHVHQMRFEGKVPGFEYPCYQVMREHVGSFSEIEITIINSFKTVDEAKRFETRLIAKDGNLNTNKRG